jgi:hypothetical protein
MVLNAETIRSALRSPTRPTAGRSRLAANADESVTLGITGAINSSECRIG